jgi:hypothetical protein
MTGLPLIETKGNDVSAFIPTNVISITDGQCFLETDLFNSGRPPGDQRRHLGLAGRRLGAGQGDEEGRRPAALDLAQFRELEAFAPSARPRRRRPRPPSSAGRAWSSCSSSRSTPRSPSSARSSRSGRVRRQARRRARRGRAPLRVGVPRLALARAQGRLDTLAETGTLRRHGAVECEAIEAFKQTSRPAAASCSSTTLQSSAGASEVEQEKVTGTSASAPPAPKQIERQGEHHGSPARVYRRRIVRPGTKKITRRWSSSPRRGSSRRSSGSRVDPVAEAITARCRRREQRDDRPPLLTRRDATGGRRLTSDRGLAGAYSSGAIKEGEQLAELLRSEGKEVVPYLVGRKAIGFYRFRNREVAGSGAGSPRRRPTPTPRRSATRSSRRSPRRQTRAGSTRSTSCTPGSSTW